MLCNVMSKLFRQCIYLCFQTVAVHAYFVGHIKCRPPCVLTCPSNLAGRSRALQIMKEFFLCGFEFWFSPFL